MTAADVRLPRVLVMAGGEGRRMGALTSRTPKPMLPIDGLPAVQSLLEQLRDQGIRQAFLSVRFNSQVISDYFGNGESLGLRLDYLHEDEPLGTAGALSLLDPSTRPLMIVNGDVVTEIPLAALAEHHAAHDAAMTVATARFGVQIPYGVIRRKGVDVARVLEKPTMSLDVIAGIYVISPETVATVPSGVRYDMPDLIATLIAAGERVVTFALPGDWLDIGTPDSYAAAQHRVTRPTDKEPPDFALSRASVNVFPGFAP